MSRSDLILPIPYFNYSLTKMQSLMITLFHVSLIMKKSYANLDCKFTTNLLINDFLRIKKKINFYLQLRWTKNYNLKIRSKDLISAFKRIFLRILIHFKYIKKKEKLNIEIPNKKHNKYKFEQFSRVNLSKINLTVQFAMNKVE